MAEFLQMPRLGQSMEEGTVVQWFKKEGEAVRAGEAVLEVMSDKANFEIEAISDGYLRKILAEPDETVLVNSPIAIIGSESESIDALMSDSAESATAAVASVGATPASEPPLPTKSPASVPLTVPGLTGPVSPRARKVAAELGVTLEAVGISGSGPGGRIIEKDVRAILEQDKSVALSAERTKITPLAARIADDLGVDVRELSPGSLGSKVRAEDVRKVASAARLPSDTSEPMVAEIIPFKGLRKLVAENVARSRQTAPHVTLTLEVDMSKAVELQMRLRPEVERDFGVKLTATDLLVKAAARGLESHPMCNAALIGDAIRVYGDKNIGVAVATDNGLIVPVVRHADQKRLGQISAELKSLVDRCRTGKQSQADLSGGTFTITNLGAFGIDVFDPIIVAPQSCILGVGRIADKPVVVNKVVEVRPMMNLCLSFDHRVLDGVPAARFLQRMKELLESPDLIFV